MNEPNIQRPLTVLIGALGGEGGGVLTEWLVEAATHAGYAAQSTSIPGVAQRTGATTYYVEIFPVPLVRLHGRRPVFSLNPVPGEIDLLVCSELLECARQVSLGMAVPQRTRVISSSARALTTAERMQPGDGRTPAAPLVELLQRFSLGAQVLDMSALAREAGTVVSAVMFGAIAGSGVLPLARDAYEAVIRGADAPAGRPLPRSAAASLRGFGLAFDAVARAREQAALVQTLLQPEAETAADAMAPAPAALQAFPPALHPLISLGYARLADYQDRAYAQRYLARLSELLTAERAGDPAASNGFAATHEAARWLALWMAFDDIVRVAELKSRARRTARVREEARAGEHDLLRVYEHFKPGVPELAGMLPARWAQRLQAWDRRRQAQGREAWALPLKLATHSVFGMAALRTLAACKRLRPRGSRFAHEQGLIERWLQAVAAGACEHPVLGLELARCGRLIKGYGSTNERGKDTLLHLIDHVARGPQPAAERARAIAAAREAALKDDAGQALDATLRQHGAPPRPVREQPIRWMRRPATGATSATTGKSA